MDEAFRDRIESIYRHWRLGVQQALQRGIQEGFVKSDINPKNMAALIVAALEGCLGLSKTSRDKKLLMTCGNGLIDVLESIRNN